MNLNVNDASVYAYTGGKAHAQHHATIVFVHGAGLDHTVWVPFARYFAHHGYNVLAPDLPAHGRSGGEALNSIDALGQWIVALVDKTGVERTALVGHSMGSLIALRAAALLGERAWLLSLLGAVVPMAVSDELLNAAKDEPSTAFDMMNLWSHTVASQIGYSQAPGMWMVGGAKQLWEKGGRAVLHTDLRACHRYADGLEHASALACPAHVVLGAKDMMCPPRATQKLVDALDSASVTRLADTGHMMLTERANEVFDALIAAVGRTSPETA